MSLLKTQTIHTTTPYTYTYGFDFNFNPYEKKLSKNNLKVYINFELTNDFDVDFDNKQITFTGDAVAKIDEVVPDSIDPINDGFNLSILRNTDISKPSVEFTDRSKFDVKYIDVVNTQLLYKQQELQEQLFFLRDQLKAVAQFDESMFIEVSNELKKVTGRIINLRRDFLDLEDDYNNLLTAYSSLFVNYEDLQGDIFDSHQLAAQISYEYNQFRLTFDDVMSQLNTKKVNFETLLSQIEQRIYQLDGDPWVLGEVIALPSGQAERFRTRLIFAGGQSYLEGNPQVSELKDIYPVVNGLVSIPDLTSRNVPDFVYHYIVKSPSGISGTSLQ